MPRHALASRFGTILARRLVHPVKFIGDTMSRISFISFAALLAASNIASAQLVPYVPGAGAQQMDQRRDHSTDPLSASAGPDSPDSVGGQGAQDYGSAGSDSDDAVLMRCRPSSVNCPVASPSGSGAITTDAMPAGSQRGKLGGPIGESRYPTSPGSGSMGSGRTGAPTGPDPGPELGIGR